MPDKWYELTDRTALAEAVRHMNEEDLRYLNRLVVERLKLISQAHSTVMMAHFSVGGQINPDLYTGEIKTGEIIRLNKKTASNSADDGKKWNVHVGFLQPMCGENIQRNGSRG